MNDTLRVLVADDELMARRRLLRLLADIPDVEVVGECSDGAQVLEQVRGGDVDVVLLDIHMPSSSGMEALQLLPEGGPYVIFCTAHAEHAVQAFDEGAVDYVLKPIEASRLQKALTRARSLLALRERRSPPAAEALQRLPISTRQGIVLVDPKRIVHAELGDDELINIHTLDGAYLSDLSLQELQKRLPDCFARVHRRAVLNLEQVVRLEPSDSGGFVASTTLGDLVIVSRKAARELKRRLGLRAPIE